MIVASISLTVLLILAILIPGAFGDIPHDDGDGVSISQWPMAFGDPRNTCQSGSDENTLNGTVRWVKDMGISCDHVLISSPPQPIVGQDGLIYMSSNDGTINALNQRGEIVWTISTGSDPTEIIKPRSPALDNDGNLYIPSIQKVWKKTGEHSASLLTYFGIECWDTERDPKWNFSLSSAYDDISAVSISEGHVVFSAMVHTYNLFQTDDVHVFSLSSEGEMIWEVVFEGSVDSTPAIDPEGHVYVGSEDGLVAIGPDGSIEWTFDTSCPVESSPSIGEDGTVYFGCKDSRAYALHPNGTLKWSFDTGDQVNAPLALCEDGRILVGSYDSYIYCLDENGTLQWKYSTGGWVESVTVDSSGKAVVSSRKAPLICLDSVGEQLWNYSLDAFRYSGAAIDSDGIVYLIDDDSNIHALGSRWPTPPDHLIRIDRAGQIELSWSPPTDGGEPPFLGYYLYRGVDLEDPIDLENIDEEMELLATLPIEANIYVDGDPINGPDVQYAIIAYNEAGLSNLEFFPSSTDESGQFIYFGDLRINADIYLGTGVFVVGAFGILCINSLSRAKRRGIPMGTAIRRPLRIVVGMLSHPFRTFEDTRENTLTDVLLYFVGFEVIVLGASVALIEVVGIDSGIYPVLDTFGVNSISGTVITLSILLLLGLILLIIGLWIINFSCWVFGGRGGYDETAKSVIYGSTPAYILGWIPFLLLIPSIWSLANQGVGFKRLHSLSTPRIIGTILLSILVIFLITVFFIWAFL